MSKFLSNLFATSKIRKSNDKLDEQSNKKANIENENDDDNFPPVAIPRRLSMSKSGRMKEKKRSKLSITDITRNENTMTDTKSETTNAKSASRDNLDSTGKTRTDK